MFAAPIEEVWPAPQGKEIAESKWPCFWCGSMQAHETGYPGGMSTVPACAEHAAEYPRENAMQMRNEVMARTTSATDESRFEPVVGRRCGAVKVDGHAFSACNRTKGHPDEHERWSHTGIRIDVWPADELCASDAQDRSCRCTWGEMGEMAAVMPGCPLHDREKPLTAREAARQRIPLGVAEVQALEGALTQADEEVALLRRAMGWAEGRGTARVVVLEAVSRLEHLSTPERSTDYAPAAAHDAFYAGYRRACADAGHRFLASWVENAWTEHAAGQKRGDGT